MYKIKIYREAASTDTVAAKNIQKNIWKRMSNKAFISKSEESNPGFKAAKGNITKGQFVFSWQGVFACQWKTVGYKS